MSVAATPSAVKVGRTCDGYCVRIEGRGTVRESAAVMEFVTRVLEAEPLAITIDLSACDYLDSTSLGCLLRLHKMAARAARSTPPSAAGGTAACRPRLTVSAPLDRYRRLVGPTRLDQIIKAESDRGPDPIAPWVPLAADDREPRELSRHIMECHKRLAEIDGPNQPVFKRIADQMAKELGESTCPAANGR